MNGNSIEGQLSIEDECSIEDDNSYYEDCYGGFIGYDEDGEWYW